MQICQHLAKSLASQSAHQEQCVKQEEQSFQQMLSDHICRQSQSGSLQLLSQEIFASMPFSRFSSSFSVFEDTRRLQNLAKFYGCKDEKQLKTITAYFHGQHTQSKQTPHQYIFQSKTPKNSTIFISIQKSGKQRCNIIIQNASGFVLSCYQNLRSCKRLPKILKFVQKIEGEHLLVVFDAIALETQEHSLLKKTCSYSTQFCYQVANSDQTSQNSISFSSVFLNKNEIAQIDENERAFFNKEGLWYLSSVFHKQELKANLEKIKTLMLTLEHDFFEKTIWKEMKTGSDQYFGSLWMDSMLVNILTHRPEWNRNQGVRFIIQKLSQTMSARTEVEGQKVKVVSPNMHLINHSKNNKNRKCVRCEKMKHRLSKTTVTKTLYICMGCTAKAKKEIHLCLDCFKPYHIEMEKKKFSAQKTKIIKKRQKGSTGDYFKNVSANDSISYEGVSTRKALQRRLIEEIRLSTEKVDRASDKMIQEVAKMKKEGATEFVGKFLDQFTSKQLIMTKKLERLMKGRFTANVDEKSCLD